MNTKELMLFKVIREIVFCIPSLVLAICTFLGTLFRAVYYEIDYQIRKNRRKENRNIH